MTSVTGAPGPLRLLLVDDEAPARRRMGELLSDIAAELPTQLVGEAANGEEALARQQAEPAQVALVDIRMPGMDGLELAQHLAGLPQPPVVIFVTAFDDYAVQAFELNAVDYLLKPVRAARLAVALDKARRLPPLAAETLGRLRQGAGGWERQRRHLSCHERGRLLLVPVAEVLYFKADLKYVSARTRDRAYLLDETLTHLEEEFADRFVRLHRGVLVARDALTGFARGVGGGEDGGDQWLALVKDLPEERLPVSRRQWPVVKQLVK